MRFFAAATAVLAAVSQVSARALSTLQSRSFEDVCAEVDADLSVLGIIKVPVDLCLCIDGLPDIINLDIFAAVLALVGEATLIADLTALITASPSKKTCFFPDHAVSKCSASNPCDFDCSDGFVPFPEPFPTQCICPAPNTVCNGVCGKFPGGCPSAKPKRELETRSAARCHHGYTACGIDGWSGMKASEAWECVDTESDIESCGGCAIPLNPFTPRGIDCTTIPGVADVSCNIGSCVVHRCLPGYTPSLDRTFCMRKQSHKFLDGDAAAAAAYGLEHMPF